MAACAEETETAEDADASATQVEGDFLSATFGDNYRLHQATFCYLLVWDIFLTAAQHASVWSRVLVISFDLLRIPVRWYAHTQFPDEPHTARRVGVHMLAAVELCNSATYLVLVPAVSTSGLVLSGFCFLSVMYPSYLASLTMPWFARAPVLLLFLASSLLAPPSVAVAPTECAMLLLAGITAGALVSRVAEMASRLAHARGHAMVAAARSASLADSRLNHLLKNQAAVVVMHATLALHELESSSVSAPPTATKRCFASDDALKLPPPADVGPSVVFVERAVRQLHAQQGVLKEMMSWCQARELFLQLEHGVYRSCRTPVKLPALLRKLAGGDAHVVCSQQLQASHVSIDDTVLRIVVEEALSNARKYGAAGAPVRVHATAPRGSALPAHGRPAALEKAPSPAGETAGEILQLTIDSTNAKGVPVLTAEQCAKAFRRGMRIAAAGDTSEGDDGSVLAAVSSGLGLDSVQRAVTAAGGTARLYTYSVPPAQHTAIEIRLPVDLRPSSPTHGSPTGRPSGLLRDACSPGGGGRARASRSRLSSPFSHGSSPSFESEPSPEHPSASCQRTPNASPTRLPRDGAASRSPSNGIASPPVPFGSAPRSASAHTMLPQGSGDWRPDDVRDLRVLLADDMKSNRLILQTHLVKAGFSMANMSHAATAEKAVKLFTDALVSRVPYALVLLDEHFGGEQVMSGSDALVKMRVAEQQADTSRCSVICRVTGHATGDGGHVDKSFLREGADGVWGKPFPSAVSGEMQSRLLPLMRRWLPLETHSGGAERCVWDASGAALRKAQVPGEAAPALAPISEAPAASPHLTSLRRAPTLHEWTYGSPEIKPCRPDDIDNVEQFELDEPELMVCELPRAYAPAGKDLILSVDVDVASDSHTPSQVHSSPREHSSSRGHSSSQGHSNMTSPLTTITSPLLASSRTSSPRSRSRGRASSGLRPQTATHITAFSRFRSAVWQSVVTGQPAPSSLCPATPSPLGSRASGRVTSCSQGIARTSTPAEMQRRSAPRSHSARPYLITEGAITHAGPTSGHGTGTPSVHMAQDSPDACHVAVLTAQALENWQLDQRLLSKPADEKDLAPLWGKQTPLSTSTGMLRPKAAAASGCESADVMKCATATPACAPSVISMEDVGALPVGVSDWFSQRKK